MFSPGRIILNLLILILTHSLTYETVAILTSVSNNAYGNAFVLKFQTSWTAQDFVSGTRSKLGCMILG